MKVTKDIIEKVFVAINDQTLMADRFPMLLNPGIPDKGITVHSHFLTYLSTCGQKAGYSAITECPICIPASFQGIGEIRSDSVWFSMDDLTPRIAFEFERFEKGDEKKLKQKVENLAITASLTESLELAVLIYWVRSGSIPRSMDGIVSQYGSNLRRNGIVVRKAAVPLMIIKCVMRNSGITQNLIFGEFLRDTRNERRLSGGK